MTAEKQNTPAVSPVAPLADVKDSVPTQKRALIAALRAYCNHHGVRPSTGHLEQVATHGGKKNPFNEYYNVRSDSMHKRIVAITRTEMVAAKENGVWK